MNKELALNPQSIDQHFQLLGVRLSGVPELDPAFAIIDHNPEYARDVYSGYIQLVEEMPRLRNADLEIVRESQSILSARDGITGSASKIGVNDILSVLGERKNLLAELAEQSADAASPYYDAAVTVLAKRLEGGHELRLSGKSPSDFDPESLKVIWGHTVITSSEALLHFTVCHYLERFIAEGLLANGIELASQKDFFVNAMVDMVILGNISSPGDTAFFELWAKPKDQGGLGWITRDRLKSYSA